MSSNVQGDLLCRNRDAVPRYVIISLSHREHRSNPGRKANHSPPTILLLEKFFPFHLSIPSLPSPPYPHIVLLDSSFIMSFSSPSVIHPSTAQTAKRPRSNNTTSSLSFDPSPWSAHRDNASAFPILLPR